MNAANKSPDRGGRQPLRHDSAGRNGLGLEVPQRPDRGQHSVTVTYDAVGSLVELRIVRLADLAHDGRPMGAIVQRGGVV
jgi:hypothetical protein